MVDAKLTSVQRSMIRQFQRLQMAPAPFVDIVSRNWFISACRRSTRSLRIQGHGSCRCVPAAAARQADSLIGKTLPGEACGPANGNFNAAPAILLPMPRKCSLSSRLGSIASTLVSAVSRR